MSALGAAQPAARTTPRWERSLQAGLCSLAVLLVAVLAGSCLGPAEGGSLPGRISRLGWQLRWEPTSGSVTDGVAFRNASYRGTPVFADLRLPFSYVDYDNSIPPYRDIVDQFGAVTWKGVSSFRGCTGSPIEEDGRRGYLIECDYRFDGPEYPWRWNPDDPQDTLCATYRYSQRLYLFDNGSFRPEVVAWGPGWNNPHTYLVALRLDPALGKNGQRLDTAYTWVPSPGGDGLWQRVRREGAADGRERSPAGYAWAVSGTPGDSRRLLIRPGADRGRLWFLARQNPADPMDGAAALTTPDELAQPARLLTRETDLYLWYRGLAANEGCTVTPEAVTGPRDIDLR